MMAARLLGLLGSLTAAVLLVLGRLVEEERMPAPEAILAGGEGWNVMSLNERDYSRDARRRPPPERVPLPAECMEPDEIVRLLAVRARVTLGAYGDDQAPDLDLRYAAWGRYLVRQGIISEGSADRHDNRQQDVQETPHEDNSATT